MAIYHPCTPMTFAGFQYPSAENYPTLHGINAPLWRRLADYKTHGRGRIGKSMQPIRVADNRSPVEGYSAYMATDADRLAGDPESLGFCTLRLAYCDSLPIDWTEAHESRPRINHCGWYPDADMLELYRGIVAKLPHGRGFLAGWTLGGGMVAELSAYIWDNAPDAARAADDEAQRVAEEEAQREETARADIVGGV